MTDWLTDFTEQQHWEVVWRKEGVKDDEGGSREILCNDAVKEESFPVHIIITIIIITIAH